jgi:hypothetical protein
MQQNAGSGCHAKTFKPLRQRAQQRREPKSSIGFQRGAVPIEKIASPLARSTVIERSTWAVVPDRAAVRRSGRASPASHPVLRDARLVRHSLALEQTGEFAFSLSKRSLDSPATVRIVGWPVAPSHQNVLQSSDTVTLRHYDTISVWLCRSLPRSVPGAVVRFSLLGGQLPPALAGGLG